MTHIQRLRPKERRTLERLYLESLNLVDLGIKNLKQEHDYWIQRDINKQVTLSLKKGVTQWTTKQE